MPRKRSRRIEAKGNILISYPGSCDVTNDLEYAKPASRSFSTTFSLMISGRRIKRGLVKDISLSPRRGEGGESEIINLSWKALDRYLWVALPPPPDATEYGLSMQTGYNATCG